MGTSMGAAVALQAAASDRRISAVISIAAFADLRTAATERAPFIASRRNLEDAFRLAETTAKFRVDDLSPVAAAAKITVPVLLIHGDHDAETPYAHALKIFAALHDPKRLITIPGGGHRGGLTPAVWTRVDQWVGQVLPSPDRAATENLK